MSLDEEADQVVAEMVRLGAKFEISRSGADGPRWYYASRAGARADIRRFWQSVDRTRPGMQAAMLRAVTRTLYAGAP